MRGRRLLAAALLSLATAIVPAYAVGARGPQLPGPVVPKTGAYSAEPVRPTGDFRLGAFAVVRDRAGARIISLETKPGIYFPSVYGCRVSSFPLKTEVIPIRRSGRFHIRETRRIRRGRLIVRWGGRWVKPGRVKGTVRIKIKKCHHRYRWTARRVPADGL